MDEPTPHPLPRPGSARDATRDEPGETTPRPPPQRPTLAQRLLPWVDLLYRLVAAAAMAAALWRALG